MQELMAIVIVLLLVAIAGIFFGVKNSAGIKEDLANMRSSVGLLHRNLSGSKLTPTSPFTCEDCICDG